MDAMILSGLQGAGKSTFCRERFWDSHVRINYDMLRTRHRESMILGACIAARLSFVVDSPNPTALEAFAEGFDEILDVFVTHEGLEIRERAHAL